MATIKTKEDTKADLFIGSREALVAAGIVRGDQFPTMGKLSVSYYSGVAKTSRGVIDENWLRIVAVTPGEVREEGYRLGDWVVHKGVPQDVARTRYQAWLKRLHKEAADRKVLEAPGTPQVHLGSNDARRRWYREGWEACRAVVEHRGYPGPSFDGNVRHRAVLPSGWSVIQGGRHA